MKLDRGEIVHKEEVGIDHRGNRVFHIKTIGGCNLIVAVDPYGSTQVLGTGAHRGFAKNQAEQRSIITWDKASGLFKNQEMNDMQQQHHDSTPHKHFQLASYFSKKMGRIKSKAEPTFEDNLLMMMLQDSAMKHYAMSGLDKKSCKDEHDKQLKYHSEVDDSYQPPYDDQMLTISYENKNNKKAE